MALSEKFEQALSQSFNARLTNVRELENPVLIVLEYSPGRDQRPISIAFDYLGGRKCWLSEPEVKLIEDIGPNAHEDYKKFVFEERTFYPYSIEPFPQAIFEDIQKFISACQSLYQHIK